MFLKDSRVAECDIVKVTLRQFGFFVLITLRILLVSTQSNLINVHETQSSINTFRIPDEVVVKMAKLVVDGLIDQFGDSNELVPRVGGCFRTDFY